MSSFDLINLMTLIQNLPLNSNVAFYNWLKILPPTGPSEDTYPSEDTLLLGSMRPRMIRTWSYYNQTSELGHCKG